MKRRSFMKMTVAGASLAALGACAEMNSEPDIVDTAVAAGSFTTLVAAVQAAGLVATLKSPGPFTVFAPTDEAFASCQPALSTACCCLRTRTNWFQS